MVWVFDKLGLSYAAYYAGSDNFWYFYWPSGKSDIEVQRVYTKNVAYWMPINSAKPDPPDVTDEKPKDIEFEGRKMMGQSNIVKQKIVGCYICGQYIHPDYSIYLEEIKSEIDYLKRFLVDRFGKPLP